MNEIVADDYDIACGLAKQVVAVTNDKEAVYTAGDKLLNFLCDKFPPTNTEAEFVMVQEMFNTGKYFDEFWENNPRRVFNALFSICVVRELLAVHHAPFNTMMKGFVRFATMYENLILYRYRDSFGG